MTNKYIYITLLAVLGFGTDDIHAQTQVNGAPRLVVNIVIDQLCTDYMEAFFPLYSGGGFQRMLDEGKVFTNASYPFVPVDRASATAAIASGTTPYYNNIIGLRWLNRKTLRPIGCVDDSRHPGLGTVDTASPEQLLTSTIGDELKIATQGKSQVFSIAPFRETAVLSAGHAANGAFWIDDHEGIWCTSTYYHKTLPLWVQECNKINSPHSKVSTLTWEAFSNLGSNFSNLTQGNDLKPFKHKFNGERQYQQYKTSALINADVTDMAIQCINSNGLGSDKITDLLSLTYYAGTYDQMSVTNCQLEIQDTYVRLDYELSRLMTKIEKQIGRNNVLFILSSTGYRHEEAIDYQAYRIPSGTFYMARAVNLMNIYLGAIWGNGDYVETFYRNQIFLNRRLLETRKISMAEALNRSQEFLAMMSGIKNVYTSLQLLTNQNMHLQKIRNGFAPDKSGDIIIETAPGWTIFNESTQESELPRVSLASFPIIFFGAGIQAERIVQPVTTDQVAPTIARCIRIRAPNASTSMPLF